MKNILLSVCVAGCAIGGTAFAAPPVGLSSASEVALRALAPDVLSHDLSPLQVREINNEVHSDDGITLADVRRIVSR